MIGMILLAAINIDCGRQLLVDTRTVETSSVKRVWHAPAICGETPEPAGGPPTAYEDLQIKTITTGGSKDSISFAFSRRNSKFWRAPGPKPKETGSFGDCIKADGDLLRFTSNGKTFAKMRRDGFASYTGTGELLTKELAFCGSRLYVNADAKNGSIAVEVLDASGKTIPGYEAENSRFSGVDSTRHLVEWKGGKILDFSKWEAWRFKSFRFRFKLENASLYSYWVSLDDEGSSNGKIAGGPHETPKPRPAVQPKISAPDSAHHISTRKHEGIPSIAVSPKGRMWATWYGGPTPYEDQNNYVVLTSSTDGGKTWKEHYVCDPDGPGLRRTFDPELWVAPDGLLRWFWTDRVGYVGAYAGQDQLWMATLDPETGRMVEKPRIVGRGVMMCKPLVLRDGTWVLPSAHWRDAPSACMYVSRDGGKTFEYRGGVTLPAPRRVYDEHCIVQKRNGDLKCYIRTTASKEEKNCLWSAESKDGGYTWSEPAPDPAANLCSRPYVTKLASGNWLLVKHGQIGEVLDKREKLTAFISKDDGKTWQGGMPVDSRNGCSYPDGQQLEDGSIVVVSDISRTGRREISFVRFTEMDVLCGAVEPPRTIISQKP